MKLIDTHTFKFICYENKENIIFSNPNYLLISEYNLTSDLGCAFCSLLNSKDKIEQFKHKLEKNISNYIKNENSNNVFNDIKLIFTEFIKINNYLVLTENSFIECISSIMDELSIVPRTTTIIEIYKNCLSHTLDNIIKCIYNGEYLINHRVNEILLPSVYFSFKIRDKNILSNSYEYTVSSIDELIKISYYQLMLNKYHIKHCIYPNCNKVFTAPVGQAKYCENPCPDNPNHTCRSIPKNFNRKEDVQSPIEKEVDNLNEKLKRLREQYRYYAKIKKQKQKKEMIINNAEILKNVSTDLRRKIKGHSSECQAKYLKVYKDFLNEIESNLKSSPKEFKIKKPKY